MLRSKKSCSKSTSTILKPFSGSITRWEASTWRIVSCPMSNVPKRKIYCPWGLFRVVFPLNNSLDFILSFETHLPYSGVPFEGFFEKVLQQVSELEKGREMCLCGNPTFVIGGIGVSTSDLPQGNDKAGIKRQNAHKGCRKCHVTHDQIPALLPALHRTQSEIVETRARIANCQTKTGQKEIMRDTGVRMEPSPFEKISLDICESLLFGFVLFCFVLFCFVLFCFVLFCFVLFWLKSLLNL